MNLRIARATGAFLAACLLSVLCRSVEAQDQPQPKPGPEQKRLEVWVGDWAYEGAMKETPLAPASKFTGKISNRLILGGFFLEQRWKDDPTKAAPATAYESVVVQWYDPATNSYKDSVYNSDGSVGGGETTVEGNTWRLMGAIKEPNGKERKHRGTSVLSADGAVCKVEGDFSSDGGKTWMPLFELTMKRIKK